VKTETEILNYSPYYGYGLGTLGYGYGYGLGYGLGYGGIIRFRFKSKGFTIQLFLTSNDLVFQKFLEIFSFYLKFVL
jgi:hypothetical protein